MIVADASPLIAFGKHGKLEILKSCFKKIAISEGVYGEVVLKKESPEAAALLKAVNDKWITVENVTVSQVLDTKSLGQGEKEAISLARKRKTVLLIDDDSAKAYASILGVESHGSLYAIYVAYLRKIITKEEVVRTLEELISDGFYVSIELYSKFYSLLNSLKN